MLAIAHRAGNALSETSAAIGAGVDLVEADVRYHRGSLELRHTKMFGPWILWDYPWEFARRSVTSVPTVEDVLPELGESGQIMLDLKGIRSALPRRLAHVLLEARVPVTVCTRRWWMLDAFAEVPNVRLVLSAGNLWEMYRLRALVSRHPRNWPGGRRAFGVSVKRTLLTPRIVAELHRHVEVVMAWRVDTRTEMDDARRLGVTGAIGKNVEILRDPVPSP